LVCFSEEEKEQKRKKTTVKYKKHMSNNESGICMKNKTNEICRYLNLGKEKN